MTESAALLRLAEDVAREAAELVVSRRPPGRLQPVATKSSETDVVTELDRASERLITERVLAARPDDGFLGEEGTARDGTSGVTWVVDPIDGTVNFLYGIPTYAVSVAARVGDVVEVGVVVNPVSGEVWTARRGHGAWWDGVPVRCPDPPPLERALVGTGFGYGRERRARQAADIVTILPAVRDIRRIGSAAIDLCAVATGRLDAYFEQGAMPWDIAAGGLVATEAGARLGGLRGRPAGEALTVAAAPGLYEELTVLLESVDADRMS